MLSPACTERCTVTASPRRSGVFDHDNGVCSLWNWRACHRSQQRRPGRTILMALCSTVAPALISPTQRNRAGKVFKIFGTNGKAIASRARKGREIAISQQVLRQH